MLFGGDPTAASVDTLEIVRREVPTTAVAADGLADRRRAARDDRVGELAHAKRAGCSTSGAYGSTAPSSSSADELAEVPLLHDRFVLLRKGKHTYHLVEVAGR